MRPMRLHPALLCLLAAWSLLLLIGGCSGSHAALDPASPQNTSIKNLFWLFFWVAVAVQVLVTLALLPAWLRRHRTIDPPPIDPEEHNTKATFIISILVLITTITLAVLLLGDFFTGRATHAAWYDPEPLKIKITGRQWWWEVQYQNDPEPYKSVTTANEIHLPLGKTIEFDLESADVIHSFWVPNLHGKKDMIPGHPTTLRVRPDREGTFFGQCAEFCGEQHAKMRLMVIVEAEDKFNAWLEAANRPAPEPVFENQKRGKEVFLTSSCVMCHTINGTTAGSRVGPNLTHVAGRQMIAAASVYNNRGNLAGWVLDPHKFKPGVRMPQNALDPTQLRDLLDYLEMLK